MTISTHGVHVLCIRFTKRFNNGHSPSSVKTTDLGCLSTRFKLVIRHIGICLKRIETSIDFLEYHRYSALQLGIW